MLKAKPWREKVIFILPLFGVILWTFLTLHLRESILTRFEESQRRTFLKASSILEEKALSFIHALQGMGGVVIADNFNPDSKAIREYAVFRNFFNNFPGALGFGFIRKVEDINLNSYLNKNKSRDGFNFRQLEDYREDHFIIEFIEPYEKNKEALGLDVASEETRRIAARFAIDNDLPTLTGPITLVQAEKRGTGFLFFLPLYSRIPHPTSLQERRSSFVGFAYTPILAESLLSHVKTKGSEDFHYNLVDATDPSKPLELFTGFKTTSSDEISFTSKIQVGSRTWIFQGDVIDRSYTRPVSLVFTIVLLLGFTFWAYIFFKIRRLIEEWKSTEKKAIDIESWQKAVLNGTIYPMVATDAKGVITIFNAAAEKLLGYTAEEMVGKLTPGVFHDHEEVKKRTELFNEELGTSIKPGFETFITKPLLTGAPFTAEWTYVPKNGDPFPARLTITTILSDEGEVTGFVGVAEDLREMKKMSRLIEEQRGTIVQAAKLSALGEMAASIGHEINNPLSIINSRIFLMKMQQKKEVMTSENLTEHLSFIEETVFRISSIIKGLKTFSRDSSQEELVSCSLASILEDTLALCQERFKKDGIEIHVEGPVETILPCRPIQLSQVFMNLLSNSYDAISTLEERWVRITVSLVPNMVRLSFVDSGNGIDEAIINKIMAPFFTTKEVGKGTGLGLSISKGIIESHKGKIFVNNHGPHTEFIIELPL